MLRQHRLHLEHTPRSRHLISVGRLEGLLNTISQAECTVTHIHGCTTRVVRVDFIDSESWDLRRCALPLARGLARVGGKELTPVGHLLNIPEARQDAAVIERLGNTHCTKREFYARPFYKLASVRVYRLGRHKSFLDFGLFT